MNPVQPPFDDPIKSFLFLVGSVAIIVGFFFLLRKWSKKKPMGPGAQAATTAEAPAAPAPEAPKGGGRWWQALSKTRLKFEWGSKKSEIAEIKAALEEAFLISDLGVKNTADLISNLPWDDISREPEEARLADAKKKAALTLDSWLSAASDDRSWPPPPSSEGPVVLWFVGVNGVGKTTSIAKLASELKNKGHSVLLAAGDTFRAAAGEQLEIWAQRLGIECVRGAAGADSSSVLFDAIKSAQSKGIQYVLCDSAGRLHNQSQLMEALAKNKRVMEKALPTAPHETLLVLDAHTGQNMLSQAKQFHESVKLTGLILTKLDGSARGGAVVAVAKELGLPIRRLGLGESAEDFCEFQRAPFISALLGT